MSNYTASVYSQEQDDLPAFAPGCLPSYQAPLPSSLSAYANSPSSSSPPTPPPPAAAAPAPAPAPSPAPTRPPPPPPLPAMESAFLGGKFGDGLRDLSEITVLGEEVLSAIEKDSKQGNIMGTLRQTVLHRTPEFVEALKKLAEMTEEMALMTRMKERFKDLEVFRVKTAIVTTLKVLRAMTDSLLGVVKWGKHLAKHVRVKMIERLGMFHYGIEQFCLSLDKIFKFNPVDFRLLNSKVKEIRTLLKAQNGEEEPKNAKVVATQREPFE